MILDNLCPPAVLYIVFSLTHIIIDIFKNLYNTALLKFFIMIVFSIVLSMLCNSGLGIVSWIIIFIPFISMTIMSTLLLMSLGISPSTGKITKTNNNNDNNNNNNNNKK